MNIEKFEFPISFSCTDIVLTDVFHKHIYMIRKSGSTKLHLIGGFVDPTDIEILDGAKRECEEEIGLSKSDQKFIKNTEKSFLVQDKNRYEKGKSKHRMRSFIHTGIIHDENVLVAGDDAESFEKVPLSKFKDLGWVCENVIHSHSLIIFKVLHLWI